jgi:hypothetical protein
MYVCCMYVCMGACMCNNNDDIYILHGFPLPLPQIEIHGEKAKDRDLILNSEYQILNTEHRVRHCAICMRSPKVSALVRKATYICAVAICKSVC